MPNLLPIRGKPGFQQAALYNPQSVVLVADPAVPEAAILARNLGAGGFHGRLFSVGLPAEGLTESPSIAELPEAPDLAVLCLPPEAQEASMAALAARGCYAAILPGAAPDLVAISARTGVRALGQGSFGLCIPGIGLNASLTHLAPVPGRLALVTQSAALARAVLDWAAAEAVGFSHVIGVGGNASLGFAMALDWLARDANTGAVLLDIRRIRNRRSFISAARAVARTRPVVAIRAGGRSADASGIGDAVLEAALRRAGVLRVSGLEDLLSAAETLARVRPRQGGGPAAAQGDRIGIVTNGIGIGQLAADAVIAGGGRLAVLSEEALAALTLLLPEGWRPGNPLSLGPTAGPRLAEAAAMLAGLPEVDAVVALHAPAPEGMEPGAGGDVTVAALIAATKAGGGRAAPILAGWVGQASAGPQRQALARAGLAAFDTPEAAVRGALHLARDRRNRAAAAELPPREVLELAPDRAAVERILAKVRAIGRLTLTEEEALGVLAAYGIPTVPGRRAVGPEEAADAAAMLRPPVVLKILSPDLAHKSEVGGVVLGLDSPAAVQEAAVAMLRRVRAARPEARIEGFLVQRQAARALELRLRLGDDAMFGPWIGFGQGGTAADLAGDEAYDLPPLNLALAGQLIARSRTARLLAGFRDWRPANQAAVADALVRLSQIAVDFPEIATLSINPLFADAEGVLAVDAELALRPAGEAGRLAIPPYPGELALPFRTPSGEVLLIRPIRPEDAAAHAEAFRNLAPEDVRWRFFSQLREMSPALVARLTQIDYGREMAFIATRRRPGQPEETVGAARLIREPAGEFSGAEAEFAVIVLPGMKGQGLGRHLMERLFDWGRANGVRSVVGHVLVDNRPMLGFVRALGFGLRRSAEEEDVMEARLDL
ncbi:GNAT family N-acetyltransferase [Siccirubricoccus sp. G192]|nr:GNAT family N-acetyltransferase [Siccirubricoccus sp. G192]